MVVAVATAGAAAAAAGTAGAAAEGSGDEQQRQGQLGALKRATAAALLHYGCELGTSRISSSAIPAMLPPSAAAQTAKPAAKPATAAVTPPPPAEPAIGIVSAETTVPPGNYANGREWPVHSVRELGKGISADVRLLLPMICQAVDFLRGAVQ